MILALRTDNPTAELHLLKEGVQIDQELWQAHRELSNTLLLKIEQILERNHSTLNSLEAIVVFKGPGSFTGLRIGITVANTLAFSLQVPITGISRDDWLQKGVDTVRKTKAGQLIMPEYGADARITKQRK